MGESVSSEAQPLRFLTIAAEVALVVSVIRVFGIEETFGLVSLTPVILVGFILHAWLPRPYRLWFFVALSMVGIGVVLGVRYGSVLIVMALGLIALCHLPIRFALRLTLLVGAGAVLAGMRADWVWSPGSVSTVLLPILGAMFMFRLILYLYHLRHETEPAPISQRLAYFFLLPNVCFPLFPVVDYQAFRRTYYDAEAHDIYQKGVLWMVRGVTHILLYRLIYHHLLLSPTEVVGLGGVIQYTLTTYGLYLRISGQFHLIVGILCLFGFNLPETHRLYFLASSFNDYWRRVNIYWKDFMMKVFYYPVMMRSRRWGMKIAVVVSTVVVFTATWLLHSYQWFWLQGTFPVSGTDAVFWAILAAGVVLNSLREARTGRRRSIAPEQLTIGGSVQHAAKVVGMFVVVCLLWSLWSSASIAEWTTVVARGADSDVMAWGVLLLALAAAVGLGATIQWGVSRGWRITLLGNQPPFGLSATYACGVCLVLMGGGLVSLGEPSDGVRQILASVREDQLNEADRLAMERGYYEGLLDAPRFTEGLWWIRSQQPPDWVNLRETAFTQDREDLLEYELRPMVEGEFHRSPFFTNRWGMRDDEYEQTPDDGVYRIATVGASYTMGSGVAHDSIYPTLLEHRMNSAISGGPRRVEVLNFAVAGYSLLQSALTVDTKILSFQPDLLLMNVHENELNRLGRHVWRVLPRLGSLGIDPLDRVLEDAGVRSGMGDAEIIERLRPRLGELLSIIFTDVASKSLDAGVTVAVVYVPTTDGDHALESSAAADILRIAEESGFVPLNIVDAFVGHRPQSIQVAPWDTHPTAAGHEILASRLFEALVEESDRLDLPGN